MDCAIYSPSTLLFASVCYPFYQESIADIAVRCVSSSTQCCPEAAACPSCPAPHRPSYSLRLPWVNRLSSLLRRTFATAIQEGSLPISTAPVRHFGRRKDWKERFQLFDRRSDRRPCVEPRLVRKYFSPKKQAPSWAAVFGRKSPLR